MPSFAEAIERKGAPLTSCFGFIDGTTRPIARPIRNQRIMYSGHKRIHCLKFQVQYMLNFYKNNFILTQAITTPNGLIANMFGPVEGRRHDAFILSESGVLDKLRPFTQPNGQPYVVYGDPAYGIKRSIISPFQSSNPLTPAEQDFNTAMSGVRVSVEWTFGKIIQLFAFLDFKKNIKVLLQPVGKYYVVGALLTNCYTCLYGSQTSSSFNVPPPSLETYLSNQ